MRYPVVVLGLLLATACSTLAQGEQTQHRQGGDVGPCVGIAVVGTRAYACFQSGVTAQEGCVEWRLPELPFRPFDMAAHASGKDSLLAVGGGEPARSGWVCVLDAEGKLIAKHRVGRDVVYAVAISPDGKHLAAGCANGQVLLYGLPRFGSMRTLQRHTAPCRSVAFSPDGARLASGGRDGLVIVHSPRDRKRTVLQDHTAGVECVAFSPDSQQIASGALDGKVRVHQGDVLRRTYQKLGAPVSGVVFVPGGRLYAGLGDGRVLRLGRNGTSADVLKHCHLPLFAMAYAYTVEEKDVLLVGLDGASGSVVAEIQSPDHEAPTATSNPASRPASAGPASRPGRR